MLQIRSRDGDRRWLNPERDIVYSWPRLISASLMCFENFEGNSKVSRDELIQTAQILGKLTSDCVKENLPIEVVYDRVVAIQFEHPYAYEMIAGAVLGAGMKSYVLWVREASPKTKNDMPLSTEEVEAVLGNLNRLMS